ncbi:MAG: type III secretion system cytoplasmic ring protein SctQ [Deltaproteobacteria bacterium]|nr:type III secretion system cytoplasmic ring protein SctQ [Deltaproteobacteria bacterium]
MSKGTGSFGESGGASVRSSSAGAGGPPRRPVRPFLFPRLEKVPRSQLELVRRLEWMLPDGMLTGEVGESVKQGLHRVFDDDVVLWLDYVHALPPRSLRKIMGDPTFLGVIAPAPHGPRGLVELDLVLAHSIIDLLLGAPGESAVARPLTEIEQGVLSYVLLETFKAFSPGAAEPGRHRLRLERVVGSIDEGLALFEEETTVAVVELKVLIGAAATGYLRLHLPASAIHAAVPPENSPYRRSRRLTRLRGNIHRLSQLRIPVRAEIGRAELTGGDIAALRSGDVMLVDELTTRSDKGENGRAHLRIGAGRAGKIEASLELVDGTYKAKIEKVVLGEDAPRVAADAPLPEPLPPADTKPPPPVPEYTLPPKGARPPSEEEEVFRDTAITDLAEQLSSGKRGWGGDRTTVTKPDEDMQADAADLLNDVPLQVAVELGRVPITAEELVSLHIGRVLDLGRAPGEPVDLSVNGKIVARGELVEIEGQLGVRIVGMAE